MFKIYFLTTKLNLMKKLKTTGRSFVMAVSLCVAFMFLGASAVSAQNWVTSDEAVILLKGEIETLDNAFPNAQTDEQRMEIAFKRKYYFSVMVDIRLGTEVPEAVSSNRPTNKPQVHASGLIAFDGNAPTFKQEANALVATATDLLSN